MNVRSQTTRRAARRQRGISLAVSLVLLVVVTLLALGSMRGVVLQSRMSGTTHDRNLAFQAAEVALRAAERRAATATPADFPATGCTNGYCAQPAVSATPNWMSSAFNGWSTATAAVPTDAAPPEAIVEDMGEAPAILKCENQAIVLPNCMKRHYLVTARSEAPDRASVLVQSQYAAP